MNEEAEHSTNSSHVYHLCVAEESAASALLCVHCCLSPRMTLCISSCIFILFFNLLCSFFGGEFTFFLLYCAIKKRLQCGVTVSRPGVDCVQETFSPSSFCSPGSFSLTDIQLSGIFMEISVLTDV